MNLLEIKNLKMDFGKNAEALRAIDDVSFTIGAGETVCLVGESGCGKTVTALSIARLVPTPPANYVGGEILLNGRDTLKMSARELQQIRGGVVSYVFQDPGASLNPVFRIGNQIKESLKLHKPEKANDAEVIRLLKLVGIPAPESRIKNYPFEMSGGMQQRVMIAMALASEPKLLVADEPTTALDVTIQAQILDLLSELKQRLGMAILLITHNLGIVGDMADRVAVMYAGQIVELAPAKELLRRPLHPYTKALMNSVPKLRGDADRLSAIPGNVPRIGNFPPGCRFAPRCPIAKPECSEKIPELLEVEPGRFVRCPFWKELRLKSTLRSMTAKSKYRLTTKGQQFISAPGKDSNDRVSANYYKKLILLFAIENGSYQPAIFKKYVETLNILTDPDYEEMTTRQYVEWKHNIDSAKDQLQKKHGLLAKATDGSFVIPAEKFTEALRQVSDFIEASPSPVTPEIIEQQEYPAEKVSTVITRRIRDTLLSNSVKKQRNYECQVCGIKLPAGNSWYAEVHHLKPLGHDGPDTESNMLVLCPNHHVLFDYGAIAIHPENTSTVIDGNGKAIATLKPPAPRKDYIQFHYAKIFSNLLND